MKRKSHYTKDGLRITKYYFRHWMWGWVKVGEIHEWGWYNPNFTFEQLEQQIK